MTEKGHWDDEPTEVYYVNGTRVSIYGELDVEAWAKSLLEAYINIYGEPFNNEK